MDWPNLVVNQEALPSHYIIIGHDNRWQLTDYFKNTSFDHLEWQIGNRNCTGGTTWQTCNTCTRFI